MTKHILDRDRETEIDGGRTARFAQIERQTAPEGSHKAAKSLHRRPQTRGDARAEQFLRIERGSEA